MSPACAPPGSPPVHVGSTGPEETRPSEVRSPDSFAQRRSPGLSHHRSPWRCRGLGALWPRFQGFDPSTLQTELNQSPEVPCVLSAELGVAQRPAPHDGQPAPRVEKRAPDPPAGTCPRQAPSGPCQWSPDSASSPVGEDAQPRDPPPPRLHGPCLSLATPAGGVAGAATMVTVTSHQLCGRCCDGHTVSFVPQVTVLFI